MAEDLYITFNMHVSHAINTIELKARLSPLPGARPLDLSSATVSHPISPHAKGDWLYPAG